ncbi:MAG: plasmid stabilization protein [Tardiphaga sp.]|nr:plasmid stabilization protein [Tardiphaga sp.]
MILLSADAAEDVERLRAFLDRDNPNAAKRALAAIWAALERIQQFTGLGMPTEDAAIRQVVVRFGAHGYIARYVAPAAGHDILVTRIWQGREARK